MDFSQIKQDEMPFCQANKMKNTKPGHLQIQKSITYITLITLNFFEVVVVKTFYNIFL